MKKMNSGVSAQRVFESALDDLEHEEWDEALQKAETLRKLSFSGCYEIEAEAWLGKGDPEKAVALLRGAPGRVFGVQLALANILSKLGRLEEALAEYEAARQCRGADIVWLNYYVASTLYNLGRAEEALQRCPVLRAGELRAEALSLRATLLSELGRHGEAGQLAREGLAENPKDGWLLQALAVAEKHAGRTDESQRLALQALLVAPTLRRAQSLFQEAEPCDGFRYWLTVKGCWHEPMSPGEGILHFFRHHHLAAASEEEALRLAAECEPEEVRPGLEIENITTLGPFPTRYGILQSQGGIFYPPD